jgi:hypothetical protein
MHTVLKCLPNHPTSPATVDKMEEAKATKRREVLSARVVAICEGRWEVVGGFDKESRSE